MIVDWDRFEGLSVRTDFLGFAIVVDGDLPPLFETLILGMPGTESMEPPLLSRSWNEAAENHRFFFEKYIMPARRKAGRA
jgi:hypothetical protein